MYKYQIIDSIWEWGLDPEVVKMISITPEEIVVEYYVTDSRGGKIIDPVETEAVTTFVTYPIERLEEYEAEPTEST